MSSSQGDPNPTLKINAPVRHYPAGPPTGHNKAGSTLYVVGCGDCRLVNAGKNTLACLHTLVTSPLHLLRSHSLFQFLFVLGRDTTSTPHLRSKSISLLSSYFVSRPITPFGFCRYILMSSTFFLFVIRCPAPGSLSYFYLHT